MGCEDVPVENCEVTSTNNSLVLGVSTEVKAKANCTLTKGGSILTAEFETGSFIMDRNRQDLKMSVNGFSATYSGRVEVSYDYRDWEFKYRVDNYSTYTTIVTIRLL